MASLPAQAALPQAVNFFIFDSNNGLPGQKENNPIEAKHKKIQKCIDIGMWGGVTALAVCSALHINEAIKNNMIGNGKIDLVNIATLIGLNAAMMTSGWYTLKKIKN